MGVVVVHNFPFIQKIYIPQNQALAEPPIAKPGVKSTYKEKNGVKKVYKMNRKKVNRKHKKSAFHFFPN